MEDDRTHFELRLKEMAKKLNKYVQKRKNDIKTFKSDTLITPADCIHYSKSEHVRGIFFSKNVNTYQLNKEKSEILLLKTFRNTYPGIKVRL